MKIEVIFEEIGEPDQMLTLNLHLGHFKYHILGISRECYAYFPSISSNQKKLCKKIHIGFMHGTLSKKLVTVKIYTLY